MRFRFGIAWRVGDEFMKRYQGFGIDLEDASGQKHHLLPVPSVFIVDTQRKIRFVYSNPDHRVRIETKALVEAAQKVAEESKHE